MKKTTILLLILISACFYCSAKQTLNAYVYETTSLQSDLETPLIRYSILLYEGDEYEFKVTADFSDFVFTQIISHGKYIKNEKEFVLNDDFNGYNLTFEIAGESLLGRHIFKRLYNAKFSESGLKDNQSMSPKRKLADLKLLNEKNNKVYFPLSFGSYAYHDYVKLILKNNGRYSYMLYDQLISEGTFSRIQGRNELVLYDDFMDYSFTFFIKEDMLVDNFIPYETILIHESIIPNYD